MRRETESYRTPSGRLQELTWTFEAPGNLRVEVRDGERVLGACSFASRFHGNFGGSAIVVSPRATYAAIFMHSGQSEQGYELLRLDPFARLAGYPFDLATGDPPVFSPDEACLVMLNHPGGCAWRDATDGEAADIWFSQLVVQDLRSGAGPAVHEVIVDPHGVTLEPGRWVRGITGLRFTAADELELSLPWKRQERVRLPLRAGQEIHVAGPPAGWVDRGYG